MKRLLDCYDFRLVAAFHFTREGEGKWYSPLPSLVLASVVLFFTLCILARAGYLI